jgi:hypothetical protein
VLASAAASASAPRPVALAPATAAPFRKSSCAWSPLPTDPLALAAQCDRPRIRCLCCPLRLLLFRDVWCAVVTAMPALCVKYLGTKALYVPRIALAEASPRRGASRALNAVSHQGQKRITIAKAGLAQHWPPASAHSHHAVALRGACRERVGAAVLTKTAPRARSFPCVFGDQRAASTARARGYLTVSVPSIPAVRCPGTEQ